VTSFASRPERFVGLALCAVLLAFGAAAPWLTPNDPSRQFADFVYAPPMLLHVFDANGTPRAPFIYPLVLEDRLARTYSENRAAPVPLRLFQSGALMAPADNAVPWLPLGADSLGRDQLARLASGTRLSLGVALAAALGALAIGAVVGSIAGFFGGFADDALMRVSDFIIALPAVYVVLALRAALPLVLTTAQVFGTMVLVLTLVGWPMPARGVRAVIASEKTREYAEAARALGASRTRLLLLHLLPAARGFLAVQTALLVPAFVLAEATLSYVGLGFAEPIPSWGAMLRDAGRGRALLEAPWLFAPAAAIVCAALAVTLVAGVGSARGRRVDRPITS
jgi:peptide/nickel transport system permease protein